MGGEEFLMLLVDVNHDSAMMVAKNCASRWSVRASSCPWTNH